MKALWIPILTVLLSAPANAPGQPAPVDVRAVDTAAQEALAFWQVPGVAVAVVRGGEVAYLQGHGVRDLTSGKPVTPDTVFPIASCTKAFTTTAMALLIDEGKLAWDDPVRKHVPFFRLADPHADALVTLRDLVTHRTGVRAHELLWYRSPWSQEEIIRRAGRLPVELPFRGSFHYQTTMFQAAGWAVGTASGGSWADFVRKRLLDPLDLRQTSLTTAEAERFTDRAAPHDRGPIPSYRMAEADPAGSVHSTAADLAKWLKLHLGRGEVGGKRLVSEAALGETHTPQNLIRLEGLARALNPETQFLAYGMAWVIQDYRGVRLLAHAGAIDGFRAHLTLVPHAGLGLVLLANRHETRLNLALSNTLVDLLLGLPKRDWNRYIADQLEREARAVRPRPSAPATGPPRDLRTYAGSYEHPAYGTAEIKVEKGALVWRWYHFTTALGPTGGDTFVMQEDRLAGAEVVFVGGAGGVATVRVGAPYGVEFRRTP